MTRTSTGTAGAPIPIEAVDLGELLGREVRGGDPGALAVRLSELHVAAELHGYVSAEVQLPWPRSKGPLTFDLHHAVLMARANFHDRVVPELSLEYEHGGREFYVTYGFIDFIAAEWLVVRAGYFPAPVGSFNEYQYPDFLRKSVAAPLALRAVIPAVWSETGLEARGKLGLGSGASLNYAVFVSNGLEQKDGEGGDLRDMRGNHFDETDSDKAVGGRIGLAPFEGLDLGVSGYTGAYTTDGSRRLHLLDVDATLKVADLTVRAEAAAALVEVTGDTQVRWGAYGLIAYRAWPGLEPYLQLDFLRETASPMGRVLAGVVYYPFPEDVPQAMIKLEGSVSLREQQDASGQVVAQATVGF